MTANPMRGEADLNIGGKTHTVRITMAALEAISRTLGVDKFVDLPEEFMKISNWQKIIRACLDANGLKSVTDDEIAAMDFGDYMGPLLNALLRTKSSNDNEAAPDPQRGQRKK